MTLGVIIKNDCYNSILLFSTRVRDHTPERKRANKLVNKLKKKHSANESPA